MPKSTIMSDQPDSIPSSKSACPSCDSNNNFDSCSLYCSAAFSRSIPSLSNNDWRMLNAIFHLQKVVCPLLYLYSLQHDTTLQVYPPRSYPFHLTENRFPPEQSEMSYNVISK